MSYCLGSLVRIGDGMQIYDKRLYKLMSVTLQRLAVTMFLSALVYPNLHAKEEI